MDEIFYGFDGFGTKYLIIILLDPKLIEIYLNIHIEI